MEPGLHPGNTLSQEDILTRTHTPRDNLVSNLTYMHAPGDPGIKPATFLR